MTRPVVALGIVVATLAAGLGAAQATRPEPVAASARARADAAPATVPVAGAQRGWPGVAAATPSFSVALGVGSPPPAAVGASAGSEPGSAAGSGAAPIETLPAAKGSPRPLLMPPGRV